MNDSRLVRDYPCQESTGCLAALTSSGRLMGVV